ncbi:MAG: dTMP kinase [Crenarchaeota archaeon]|nr:dTMP kinase [Thermoproteota archaeon]
MRWIVFEGPDCVGKSTIIRELSKILQEHGWKTFITSEPSSSPIGKLIRDWLLKEKIYPPHVYALLFTSDRYYHYHNIVKKMLEKGYIVLQERYKLSTIVYQSEMGVDEEWLIEINKYVPDPDLVIVLDADIETLRRRLETKSQREIFENDISMICRVRQKYLEIARRLGLPIVDTSRDLETVLQQVYKLVMSIL